MARDAFLFCPCSRRLELIHCGQIHSDWANQQAQTSFGGPHPLLQQTKKNLSFQTGFLNMVGERGLPGSASLPCGPLLKQRCLAALGSNLLRRSSSSFATDEKKPVFSDRFLKYGRRERITWLCEPALRAVAEATLSRCARLKPPSEVLILFCYRRKKTCLFRQVS